MTDSGTRRAAGLDASHEARHPTGRGPAHRFRALRGFLPEIALLTTAAVLWQQSGRFRATPPEDLGPAFWPRLLIIMLGVCALARAVQKARTLRSEDTDPDATAADQDPRRPDGRRIALAILSILGYVVGAIYLGYLIATAAFVVCFLLLSGRRRKVVNTALGAGSALAFSYLFLKVVYVSVPSGVGVFDSFTVGVYELIGIY